MTELTQEILFSTQTQPENERLALLKQHFPNCFDKYGAFLPEKMADMLRSDGIAIQKEGYHYLNWLGKSYARVLKDTPPETLLTEDTAHNNLPENANSENLLIKGDNLEVLKHLKNAYKNQIKMIYIDPPYNTGSDGFVYQDDRKFTPEQLAQLGGIDLDEAKRVLDFTAKKSNSHSAWLTFMYPRLHVARELLRDDGVIFISIDDNEQAQLKILCDEVFGEENFVAELPTIMNLKGNNDEFGFAGTHEYTLVYIKKQDSVEDLNGIPLEREDIAEYEYNDGLGKYKEGATLMRTGEAGAREARPHGYYPIYVSQDLTSISLTRTNVDDYEVYPKTTDGKEMSWRRSADKLSKTLSEFVIKQTKNGISFYKKQRLADDLITGKKAKSLFYKPQYSSGNGTAILKSKDFFGKRVFNNPKPIELLKDFMRVGLQRNEPCLVLDFFAGSGSIAHAAMQLNLENQNNCIKYICVQLPENLDEALKTASKDAKKTIQNAIDWLDENHKPHNLFEITKARIELATAKIRTENPDYSGDLGFKIFQTEPNFQAALDDDFDPAQAEIPDSKNAMLSDEQLHTLLTTWRVYDGSRLPEKVQTIDLAGYTAYYCRHHLYLLASGFHSECVKALIEKLDNDKDFVPERIVLFSANMDSAMQKELAQAVKTYANKKGLNNLSVLARV